MAQISVFYCVVSPEALSKVTSSGFSPALLGYRLGERLQLFRSGPPAAVSGGLLVLSAGSDLPEGDFAPLIQQIIRECRARGASGLLADWEAVTPRLSQLTQFLARQLNQYGLALYVPEEYGLVSPQTRVLISSSLSGGTLELRLREALEQWGPNRAVLALERMREDFPLPCLSGKGKTVSEERLNTFLRQQRPQVYWSEEFCARYFTYREGNRVHFVLFDDGPSLLKKLELAGRVGFRTAIAPWQEISGQASEIQALLGR